MVEVNLAADKKVLDGQLSHWTQTYSRKPDMFGSSPSEPARKAAELFRKENITKILELGAGQGRDSIFFAREGFQVYALDYSQNALDDVDQKAKNIGPPGSVTTVSHDVRRPLPFADEFFDACYSHMLFNMALTNRELQSLSEEVRRILRPGGLCVYTVRHKGDPHFGKGIPRGEDMWESEGFIVHFFDRAKIESLAKGYQMLAVDEFEEGTLPRKLFSVILRKQ